MEDNSKYLIVDKSILPDIFLKVIEAKSLISAEGITVSQAVERVGLSRSAFYKYRDNVFILGEDSRGMTVVIGMDLYDEPGILSNVLNTIANFGANILTINQTIPIHGIANITISAELNQIGQSFEGLINKIREIKGVLTLRIIARE